MRFYSFENCVCLLFSSERKIFEPAVFNKKLGSLIKPATVRVEFFHYLPFRSKITSTGGYLIEEQGFLLLKTGFDIKNWWPLIAQNLTMRSGVSAWWRIILKTDNLRLLVRRLLSHKMANSGPFFGGKVGPNCLITNQLHFRRCKLHFSASGS